MKNNVRVLKFHTGRGGKFFNSGYVRFIDFDRIENSHNWDNYFFCDEKNTWYDGNGNELDYQINGDGTGYINDDNEYDTTNWVNEDELNDKQISAIKREIEDNSFYADELKMIVKKYYY